MSIDDILKLFDSGEVARIIDHDPESYIVELIDGSNDVNYTDPYYIVNKKTGSKEIYDISGDLDSFFDEYDNKCVYES